MGSALLEHVVVMDPTQHEVETRRIYTHTYLYRWTCMALCYVYNDTFKIHRFFGTRSTSAHTYFHNWLFHGTTGHRNSWQMDKINVNT